MKIVVLFGVCAILTINCLLYIIANVFINKITEYFFRGTGANDSRTISTNVGMVQIEGGTAAVRLWDACVKPSNTDHPTTCRELELKLN